MELDRELITPQTDIVFGLAIVKAHSHGGWALPGGWITHSATAAQSQCQLMDRVIARFGGRAVATRQGRRRSA